MKLPRLNEANTRSERAAEGLAEGAELRRVHHVIDNQRIAAIGGVLHHPAQTEVGTVKVKPQFQTRTEVQVIRIALRARRTDYLVTRVDCSVRKPRVPIVGVNKVPIFFEAGHEERNPSPGKNAIGRVPGKRPALLYAEI